MVDIDPRPRDLFIGYRVRQERGVLHFQYRDGGITYGLFANGVDHERFYSALILRSCGGGNKKKKE